MSSEGLNGHPVEGFGSDLVDECRGLVKGAMAVLLYIVVAIGQDCKQVIVENGAITANIFVAIQEPHKFLVDFDAALEYGVVFSCVLEG